MVNTLTRQQARSIAGAAITGLGWLAPQIQQELKNQLTQFIERRGNAALNDIRSFIQSQVSGVADYTLGDGITQSRMQRDIQQAARSISNQIRDTATRDTSPNLRQQQFQQNREQLTMENQDRQSMIQREIDVSGEIMRGRFIHQFASWKTQLILTKNKKQMKRRQ